jgi:phosphoribosylaminoimidazole-succinocarboxamide synthase
MDNKIIREQLKFVLAETDFEFLGTKYEGKVRDSYIKGDRRYLVTTDRLSCFDVVVTLVPFKGQVLNQLAVNWFEQSSDIIANHLIDNPDPSVMVVKNCQILPIEVVVRGYLAGSAWRDYVAGKAISGVVLPPGMKNYQRLASPLLTPSTKAERGTHDEPISEKEVVSRGIVDSKIWQQVHETALALFNLGTKRAAERGLILADTKYEFGLYEGKLILADEIHTLDSSRFWVVSDFEQKVSAGQAPTMLDKEPTRQWLISQGYQGNGPIPKFSDDHRVEIAKHYIDSYEKITGKIFSAKVGDVRSRILGALGVGK